MRRRPRSTSAPAPTIPPALLARVRGLAVDRDGVPVLRGIDLDVRAGEVLSLVGPNGAGKSTLLAVLAGDLHPAAGEVLLWGEPIGDMRPIAIARRRAVLPQAHRVSFPFTVADVVAMGRAPWAGTPAAYADDARVRDALAATETTEFADRSFNALSGGEQARVMLARVIAQDGAVVMLDEPTAALDLRHQELVGRLCRGLAAEGRAVIIVVHDLDLAAAYSDRVALMSAGRIDACGEPADVLTAERVGEVYRQPVRVEHDPANGTPRIVPIR